MATAGISSAISGIIRLAASLGRGCGEPCIESAEWEQIYEAAADNLDTACQKNWISTEQATQGINALIQAGQQSIQQIAGAGVHAQNALQNMISVNQAEISGLPPNMDGTTPLPSGWQSELYPPIGYTGWYATSTSQAQQISVPFIESANTANNVPSPAASVISSVPVAGQVVSSISSSTGISPTFVLIGLALLAWKLL